MSHRITGAALAAFVHDVLERDGLAPVLTDETRADAVFAAGLLLVALRVDTEVPLPEAQAVFAVRRIAVAGQAHRAIAALRTIEIATDLVGPRLGRRRF